MLQIGANDCSYQDWGRWAPTIRVTTQPLGVVFGKRIFTTYRGAQLVPAGSLLAETQDMGDVPPGCFDIV